MRWFAKQLADAQSYDNGSCAMLFTYLAPPIRARVCVSFSLHPPKCVFVLLETDEDC